MGCRGFMDSISSIEVFPGLLVITRGLELVDQLLAYIRLVNLSRWNSESLIDIDEYMISLESIYLVEPDPFVEIISYFLEQYISSNLTYHWLVFP